MLFVESYGAGSHLRVARTLQQASRHAIDLLLLGRNHWRTLALTGHRTIADAFNSLAVGDPYDLIIFSGPADVARAVERLPAWMGNPRVAVYFHESQWTYPAGTLDRLPHLVSHLEAVEISNAVWFNSRYHHRVFELNALNHPAPAVQALAREILPDHWNKSSVLYPPFTAPVAVDTLPDAIFRIGWTARWEAEKRPDLLMAIIDRLVDVGVELRLHILGSPAQRWRDELALWPNVAPAVDTRSGYLDAAGYAAVLAQLDVWLSTAEHEFFGIAAIEAARLGALPVVPDALAYAETLPSALTYPSGDVDAAAQRIMAVKTAAVGREGPWTVDARRFNMTTLVERFDRAIVQASTGTRITG